MPVGQTPRPYYTPFKTEVNVLVHTQSREGVEMLNAKASRRTSE